MAIMSRFGGLIKKKKVWIPLAFFLVASIGVVLFIILKNSNEDDLDSKGKKNKEHSVEYVDAEKFFTDNSKSVSAIDANNSDVQMNEERAYQFFDDRGFVQGSVFYEFSENGEYLGKKEIKQNSSSKHPTYQTTYLTSSGDTWDIYIIGNNIIACPISYYEQHRDSVTVLISETAEVTSYDNITNRFFITVPNETAMRVVTLEKIDAEAIESISEDILERK